MEDNRMTGTKVMLEEMTAYDALIHIDTHAVRQRYSTSRNSFITLCFGDGDYRMTDALTGGHHSLPAEFTDAPRLIAHWTQFCRTHGVDR